MAGRPESEPPVRMKPRLIRKEDKLLETRSRHQGCYVGLAAVGRENRAKAYRKFRIAQSSIDAFLAKANPSKFVARLFNSQLSRLITVLALD